MNKGLIVKLVLMAGNLNNGANYGSACLNLNNALSNANWNIGARDCETRETLRL